MIAMMYYRAPGTSIAPELAAIEIALTRCATLPPPPPLLLPPTLPPLLLPPTLLRPPTTPPRTNLECDITLPKYYY